MRCGSLKSLLGLMYAFSVQSTKGRRNYINIGRMIQKEQQASTIESNNSSKEYTFKKRNQFKTSQNNEPSLQINQQDWFPKSQQKTQQHMSTQQQQMNHKIKTAIRCQTLYYECSRKKHKIELRQYALIFCKILQLRRMNPAQRKQTQQFTNFLSILDNKITQMPPQQLVRIVYGIKQQRVGIQDMKHMLPIVEKIINQFSNTQLTQLQPKSFETLRLSTNIKLFYSLLYILHQTGSHFEKKLKSFMNQTLNYILFKSMKTKKHSKTGQYFPLQLKLAFLHSCKLINASNTCVKNLMLSILVQKQRLTLQMLLDLERMMFENKEMLEKTRKQLFTQKDIHIKYNILCRIERYINDAIPANLKKSSTYGMLIAQLASHLEYVSQLTFQQLNIMELASVKDEQQSRILSIFHLAYKNALIENYSSLSQKEDVVAFFDGNQNQGDTMFRLMGFFCDRLKIDGGNSLRPSVKKELKEFISLLCKFFGKLNFLTQSVIIDILVLSNFANLKPILTEFLEINTLSSSKKVQKPHFMRKDKTLMMDKFFTIIKHQNVFQQHCPSQYQLFINSNIKPALKQIFKSTQPMNIEKYAFYLSQYCNVLTKQSLQTFIQSILITHKQNSWTNRSFKKSDIDIIYKYKEHFLFSEIKQSVQMLNQTDIFGENVAEKQQKQLLLTDNLLSTVQNDKQVFRDFYKIQQKIRVKLRMALKNFKFIILLFENIKINVPKESWQGIINEELVSSLVLSFKSELECIKFERFLTKENCSDLTEIQGLLKNIWDRTLPEIEIRNQALVYENESSKQKLLSSTKQTTQQHQHPTTPIQNINAQQVKQKQPLDEQEQQQSEQSEYTEQVEYLHGKDFFKLETFKEYQQKQDKNSLYFYNKNKEILQEIKALTCDFSQLPKTMRHDENYAQVLKELQMHYSSTEKVVKNQQSQRKIVDLATVDDIRMDRENLQELVSMEMENRESKQTYSLRVFRKSYPSLVHFTTVQDNSQAKVIEQVIYVNGSKMRKNYRKKKVDQSKILQDEQTNSINE